MSADVSVNIVANSKPKACPAGAPIEQNKSQIISTDDALSKIYYSPQGYWRDIVAIKKLSKAAKVCEIMTHSG